MTTAAHCVVTSRRAQRELGGSRWCSRSTRSQSSLAWYESQPDFDASTSPSFTDRFDYETEDTLIAAYQRAVGTITDAVEQHAAPPVHSMPHPAEAGAVDHRGR